MVSSITSNEKGLNIPVKPSLEGDFVVENSFYSRMIEVGDILTDTKKYIVPPHQRDFSWDKEVEEFWDDLINSLDDETYFFGSMIFQLTDDEDTLEVIDGQQRIATITILLTVIRDILRDINKDFSTTVHNNYIIKTLEDEKIPKLTLNLRNKDFFKDCIQSEIGNGRKEFKTYDKNLKKEKTNRLLKKAYEFFTERVNDKIRELEEKEKIDCLKKLIHLRKRFLVIRTIVNSEENAYLLFETINERGLELSVADLFKNYLIRKAPKENKNELIDIWKEISKLLDDKVRTFLKHYWHSKEEVITEKKLFRKFKKHFEEKRVDVIKFVKELKEEAEIYSTLLSPEKRDWEDKTIYELLDDFNKLGVKQTLPVFMIAKKKFDNNTFKKLIEILTNFTIRYTIICERAENILEKRYSDIARGIRNNELKDIKGILSNLKGLYPNKDDFAKKFIGYTIERSQVAKYILKKIDDYQSTSEPIDYYKLTLEHILPQKLDKDWKKYFKKKKIKDDDVEELINKIGNLTLLDVDMNKKASNEYFTKKRDKYYKKSKLKINQTLKSIKEWNAKEIEKREEEFSEIAEKIWKIDF